MILKAKSIIATLVCALSLMVPLHDRTAMAARVMGEEEVVPAARGEVQTPSTTPSAPRPSRVTRPKVVAPEAAVEPARKDKAVEVERESISPAPEKDSRYVTIDFDNVNIAVFIKFISELTGKNFILDEEVRGNVTIVSPTKINPDEAYEVFKSVLEVHGYTTIPAGRITKIVPALKARTKDIETRLREEATSPDDRVVTQLIPLQYANPDELRRLFAPLISKNSLMVAYPPTGMLIVTDVLSNIRRLLSIIDVIDVQGIGEEITVIPLKHATASSMTKSLEDLFQKGMGKQAAGDGRPSPVVRIAADDRTNALIVLASENDTIRIRGLIDLLDKETPRGEGRIRVYYLQNGDAENMASVLSTIATQQSRKDRNGQNAIVSKEVQIVADKPTNSLVITASRDDYLVLEDVIKQLDVPRRMVYIEALIMEVNVEKDFKLGVEWQGLDDFNYRGRQGAVFGGSSGSGGFDSTAGLAQGVLPSGFSLGVVGEFIEIGGVAFPNLAAVLQAYQQDTDIHILSTPQVLTTDNEEAEIYVGKNVPYITRQDTSAANVDYTSYEYKDVGITLRITPQINQERFVRLSLYQEVTRLIETQGLSEGRPTTFKRTAQTTVIIKDANSVVIGGLIGDEMTDVQYNTPCLASVPGARAVTGSTTRSGEKTNLFIFITPHIIENPAEAERVYDRKRQEMDEIREGVIKMYKNKPSQDTPQPAAK